MYLVYWYLWWHGDPPFLKECPRQNPGPTTMDLPVLPTFRARVLMDGRKPQRLTPPGTSGQKMSNMWDQCSTGTKARNRCFDNKLEILGLVIFVRCCQQAPISSCLESVWVRTKSELVDSGGPSGNCSLFGQHFKEKSPDMLRLRASQNWVPPTCGMGQNCSPQRWCNSRSQSFPGRRRPGKVSEHILGASFRCQNREKI